MQSVVRTDRQGRKSRPRPDKLSRPLIDAHATFGQTSRLRRFDSGQITMNRKVPTFEPMIQMRKQRELAAMRLQRLQQLRKLVLRACRLRPERTRMHAEFVPNADHPLRRCLRSVCTRGAA